VPGGVDRGLGSRQTVSSGENIQTRRICDMVCFLESCAKPSDAWRRESGPRVLSTMEVEANTPPAAIGLEEPSSTTTPSLGR